MLALLPRSMQHAVEFREPSWFTGETLALLESHGVALCVSDWTAAPAPRVATATFTYWRFHGPGGRYAGEYSQSQLRARADWIRETAGDRESWVFFNNDERGFAVRNALQLRALLRDG
jgi:uncharacterized protein YecE (DUF72 family)